MGQIGVSDRYVNAYCGRVPRSVRARRYADFSLEKQVEVREKANLTMLVQVA